MHLFILRTSSPTARNPACAVVCACPPHHSALLRSDPCWACAVVCACPPLLLSLPLRLSEPSPVLALWLREALPSGWRRLFAAPVVLSFVLISSSAPSPVLALSLREALPSGWRRLSPLPRSWIESVRSEIQHSPLTRSLMLARSARAFDVLRGLEDCYTAPYYRAGCLAPAGCCQTSTTMGAKVSVYVPCAPGRRHKPLMQSSNCPSHIKGARKPPAPYRSLGRAVAAIAA